MKQHYIIVFYVHVTSENVNGFSFASIYSAHSTYGTILWT